MWKAVSAISVIAIAVAAIFFVVNSKNPTEKLIYSGIQQIACKDAIMLKELYGKELKVYFEKLSAYDIADLTPEIIENIASEVGLTEEKKKLTSWLTKSEKALQKVFGDDKNSYAQYYNQLQYIYMSVMGHIRGEISDKELDDGIENTFCKG